MTFRGKLETGGTDTIALHTTDGSTGYRIVKLQIIGQQPGGFTQESTLQIFSQPTTPTSEIDFSNNTCLATAFWSSDTASNQYSDDMTVIFDRTIFNQDIYVTHIGTASSSVNYHIELESMKLDLNENTVVTLKDIRNTNSQ